MEFPSFKSFKKKAVKESPSSQTNVPTKIKLKKSRRNERYDRDEALDLKNNGIIDRKGDKDIVLFESLPKAEIPQYRRRKGGLVLGLDFNYRLVGGKGSGPLIISRFNESRKGKMRSVRLARPTYISIDRIRTFDRIRGESEEYIPLGLDWSEIEAWNSQRLEIDGEFLPQEDESKFLNRQRQYSDLLSEDPKNELIWIEFAQSQLHFRGITLKGALERQAAILEKSMKALPRSENLAYHFMNCIAQFWDVSKTLSQWDKIINQFRSSPFIWNSYISYRLSNFSSFNYSSVCPLFERCFSLGSFDECSLLHLFQRACDYHKSCGYSEKSIALYQALFDFNFFCPDDLKTQPHEIKMRIFEEYWSSHVPKFGEEGFVGWKSYNLKADNHKISTESVKNEIGARSENVVLAWILEEDKRESCDWCAFNGSEKECDDPDRIVIFDDISPYMFTVSEDQRLFLLKCFLSFIGLPLLPCSLVNTNNPNIYMPSEEMARSSNQEKMGLFLQDFPLSFDEPALDLNFLGKSVISERNIFRQSIWGLYTNVIKQLGERLSFVRNVIAQGQSLFNANANGLERDFLVMLELCLSASNLASFEKKIRKRLARDEGSNWLWTLYSDLVSRKGEYTKTIEVYEKIFREFRNFDILIKWIEMEISLERFGNGLDILFKFCSLDSSSSEMTRLNLLQAKKVYEGSIPLIIYLEYLSCEKLSEFLDWRHRNGIPDHSSEFLFSLWMAPKRFPSELPVLVDELEKLDDIPKVWALRLYFHSLIPSSSPCLLLGTNYNPIQWLSRIWFESLKYHDILTSKHRIKRMFDKAILQHPASVTLWKAYILWSSKVDPDSSKNVYIRAINANPFCKEIYLTYFRNLDLNDLHNARKDLYEALNFMEEKELRVRCLIDEV